jgi:hypothetical protein
MQARSEDGHTIASCIQAEFLAWPDGLTAKSRPTMFIVVTQKYCAKPQSLQP